MCDPRPGGLKAASSSQPLTQTARKATENVYKLGRQHKLLEQLTEDEVTAKRQYGDKKTSYGGFSLTGISSPPGALTDNACLHILDSLGHLSGPCSPRSVLRPGLAALEGAVVVNETVDVIHCGLEERDGWRGVLG